MANFRVVCGAALSALTPKIVSVANASIQQASRSATSPPPPSSSPSPLPPLPPLPPPRLFDYVRRASGGGASHRRRFSPPSLPSQAAPKLGQRRVDFCSPPLCFASSVVAGSFFGARVCRFFLTTASFLARAAGKKCCQTRRRRHSQRAPTTTSLEGATRCRITGATVGARAVACSFRAHINVAAAHVAPFDTHARARAYSRAALEFSRTRPRATFRRTNRRRSRFVTSCAYSRQAKVALLADVETRKAAAALLLKDAHA